MKLLIYGPMFAKKSTHLIKSYKDSPNSIAITNKIDMRYGAGKIISHDGIEIDAINCCEFSEIAEAINGVETIFVDEIQFFSQEFVEKLLALDKKIFFYGLDKNFLGESFPTTEFLQKRIESVKFWAKCRCGMPADFTKKNGGSNNIIEIGGSELYEPVCKKHR